MASDETLVALAKANRSAALEALIARYRPLVEKRARAFFVPGVEREDLVQEGQIGLYSAVKDYDPERLSKFKPFAELCISRRIISAIKTATRYKHVPMNAYVSLEAADCGVAKNPVLRIDRDALAGAMGAKLSKREVEVVQRFLSGMTYVEISEELSCDAKSVDNAMQRAKRKIAFLLNQ
jgi:RNA polymerase sporulation-specific sigma factor